MQGNRWKQKPPAGYQIDREHPLAAGLQFFAPLWEGSGPYAYDLVAGTALAMSGGPAWGRGTTTGASGPGLLCAATAAAVQAPAPPALQFGWPVSIALGFRPTAAPSPNNAILFGTSHSNNQSAPYFGAALQYNSSNTLVSLEANFGGTLQTVGSATVATGVDAVVSASIASGSQALYGGSLPASAGLQVATGSYSGANTYGTNPYVFVGNLSYFTGRNPNVLAYWAAMWNRLLQPAEHAALAANVWQILRPKRAMATVLYALPGEPPESPSPPGTMRPVASPRRLRAGRTRIGRAVAAGSAPPLPTAGVRVEWLYPTVGLGPRAPLGFHVYAGVGTPDYTTPAATVLYSSAIQGTFVANLSGLTDGATYAVGVRAYNRYGEETNTQTVTVTADATGPRAVDFLTAVTIV